MARVVSVAEVRARIAAPFRPRVDSAAIGRFTLRDDQRDVVARLEIALERFGGALLCDPPGAGKTVVALAIAHRRHETRPTLVLAPASLRAQWLRSAQDANTPIAFCSLESVSRGARLPASPLLIVDEAHRLGAGATARYKRVATYAARAPVLLLTATPVVNRLDDRDRLLSLFLGARSNGALDDVIIRRNRETASLPPLRRLAPIDVAVDVPGLGRALRSLPPPFPVADGRAATALVQSTLAFAWRSSLAALALALKRREVSGNALADELRAGRWPDRRTLQRWILGDEPNQLTLELAFARTEGAPPADALRTLEHHLGAVRKMRALIASHVETDTARRADALLALIEQRAPARAVCFAHHAETVRALWSVLRRTAGVVAITGERVAAAAGRWTREEVLRALGPHAKPWRADDPRGIRLLLTTDLLAEGVELPGAEIVVHGDGAWTPARLEQRVGRARRPSSRAHAILVTGFRAPAGSSSLLQLAARLRSKRTARQTALSAAEARDGLSAIFARWSRDGASTREHSGEPVYAMVAHGRHALLALIETPAEPLMLAAWQESTRWRTSTDARDVLRLASHASSAEISSDECFAHVATRVVDRWLSRRAGALATGVSRSETSSALRTLRRRLARAIHHCPLSERRSLALKVQQITAAVTNASAASTERELRELLRAQHHDRELIAAVEAASRDWLRRKQDEPRESARLVALLLFQPAISATGPHPAPTRAAHAPPSASP